MATIEISCAGCEFDYWYLVPATTNRRCKCSLDPRPELGLLICNSWSPRTFHIKQAWDGGIDNSSSRVRWGKGLSPVPPLLYTCLSQLADQGISTIWWQGFPLTAQWKKIGDADSTCFSPLTTFHVSTVLRPVHTSGPDRRAFPLTGTFDGQTVKLPECPSSEITKAVPGSWSSTLPDVS